MSSSLRLKKIGTHFYTYSLVPGQRVYGEKIVKEKSENWIGGEWREWNPFRSKLCAALQSGLEEFPIHEGNSVLYLGSAEGTTVSHVSDIVGDAGAVIGVDISPHVMGKFSKLVETRENIIPILGDANQPQTYEKELDGMKFDVIVQDIAQKNQAEIFSKNWSVFAHAKTHGLLVIKSKSVDFTKPPEQVLTAELKELQRKHIKVRQIVSLEKYEKSHFLIHIQ